ncbi:hypothetical protein CCACVL1_27925 [Corchorus capsularis]|uniref:Uncharacterized protein n=1 Tax=Corchorus capsularis TaxID=210143 RepID=A0A1R3G862_COCAP|nr:hypothetical protein CCACVL1_27925 [Corchorus capsularis]
MAVAFLSGGANESAAYNCVFIGY